MKLRGDYLKRYKFHFFFTFRKNRPTPRNAQSTKIEPERNGEYEQTTSNEN